MPGVEAARWAVNRVPAWRPFSGVMIKWRGVQAQPRNDCERVTFARIDRDPFAGAAIAVAAELRGAHRGADQTSRGQDVGDRAGTIVTVVLK